MLSCHSLVTGVQCPARMMLLLCVMVTSVAVKATSHPASHSCPIDSNGWVASWGTTWPWRAAAGKPGQSKSASWVEWMMAPEGVWMAMGSLAVRLLQTGVVDEKKWDVQPESAMA